MPVDRSEQTVNTAGTQFCKLAHDAIHLQNTLESGRTGTEQFVYRVRTLILIVGVSKESDHACYCYALESNLHNKCSHEET